MTEFTFQMMMADLLILCGGILTAPWCGFLVDALDWHREPPTIQKAIILVVTLFLPLVVCSFIALWAYPEAFL